MPTGFCGLDEKLNGLHPGRLYVLAARPAMGKTTIVQNIAAGAALRQQRKVLFASLEMGESELAQRHLAAESGVAHQRIERAQLRDSDWPALLDTVARPARRGFSRSMSPTCRCLTCAPMPARSLSARPALTW